MKKLKEQNTTIDSTSQQWLCSSINQGQKVFEKLP